MPAENGDQAGGGESSGVKVERRDERSDIQWELLKFISAIC